MDPLLRFSLHFFDTMSKAGSNDLLDMVDMDDLLGTIGEDDADLAAAAAAALSSPSFGEQETEQGDYSKDAEAPQPSTPVAVEMQEEQEEEDEDEQQEEKDVKGKKEEQNLRPQSPQRQQLEVHVDASPLKKQDGLDRFKSLERRREQQKKQLIEEEKETEKAKAMYSGKKWSVKAATGPMRPQEAGELAVACAVKPGGKKSPREEIEELTRLEEEKKKREKALATAGCSTLPLPAKPLGLIQPATDKKLEEEEAAQHAAAEEPNSGKNEDGTGEGEGGEAKHEEDDKTCETDGMERQQETDATERRQSGQEGAESVRGPSLPSEGVKSSVQGTADDETDSVRTAGGVRSKVKDKLRGLTCLGKRDGVREPHKQSEQYSPKGGEHAQGGSTGELSEPYHGGLRDTIFPSPPSKDELEH